MAHDTISDLTRRLVEKAHTRTLPRRLAYEKLLSQTSKYLMIGDCILEGGYDMLRNIPKILPPKLVKLMMEMGHGDILLIADANYPGASHAKHMIRMDSVEIPELLEAILPFFPLDNFISSPVRLMRNLPTEPVPEIWKTYRELLEKYDTDHAFQDFDFIDRLPFYEESEKAYVIVQTGDTARYGNIILQKGVC